MEPTPKPHVSHWIAWSVIILVVGVAGFFGWRYFDEITTIYDNTFVASIRSYKKTTTTPATTTTTDATADWKTYTNDTYKFSFKYPKDWESTTFFNYPGDTNSIINLVTSALAQQIKNKTSDQILEITPTLNLKYYASSKDLPDNNNQKSNSATLLDYLKNQTNVVTSYSAKQYGDIKGYQAEQTNIGGISYYYFEHSGNVFLISHEAPKDIENIVKSFTFTK